MSALATLVGGHYGATYDGVSIGITEDGFDLIQALKEEVIDESDAFGGSMIDYFYRGGNCQVRCDSKEYKAGSTLPFWPWGPLGQMRSSALPIGRLAANVADALVLTATPNTPAATAPATLTVTLAIIAPGQQGVLKFTSKLRRVPLFLQAIPYDSTGSTLWFAMT